MLELTKKWLDSVNDNCQNSTHQLVVLLSCRVVSVDHSRYDNRPHAIAGGDRGVTADGSRCTGSCVLYRGTTDIFVTPY